MHTIETWLALIGLYVVCKKTYQAYKLLFGDRTGNSGRMKHWSEDY